MQRGVHLKHWKGGWAAAQHSHLDLVSALHDQEQHQHQHALGSDQHSTSCNVLGTVPLMD